MKSVLFLFVAALFVLPACAQKSPHETVEGSDISVTYGRPYKKGRDIFGGLEPYGKVWRTGADAATEVTFKKDGTFGGKAVKAGTYTLFTIPNATEWTVILNSELKQWGAFSYDKNKSKDVLQFNVPAKKLDNVVEQLTIRVPSKSMIIEWDKTQITIPTSF